MSLDAQYILRYEGGYFSDHRHPSTKDIKYLEENFGGEVVDISGFRSNYYWDKPKHKLLPEQIDKLVADQVLECEDAGFWVIVKEPTY